VHERQFGGELVRAICKRRDKAALGGAQIEESRLARADRFAGADEFGEDRIERGARAIDGGATDRIDAVAGDADRKAERRARLRWTSA